MLQVNRAHESEGHSEVKAAFEGTVDRVKLTRASATTILQFISIWTLSPIRTYGVPTVIFT